MSPSRCLRRAARRCLKNPGQNLHPHRQRASAADSRGGRLQKTIHCPVPRNLRSSRRISLYCSSGTDSRSAKKAGNLLTLQGQPAGLLSLACGQTIKVLQGRHARQHMNRRAGCRRSRLCCQKKASSSASGSSTVIRSQIFCILPGPQISEFRSLFI